MAVKIDKLKDLAANVYVHEIVDGVLKAVPLLSLLPKPYPWYKRLWLWIQRKPTSPDIIEGGEHIRLPLFRKVDK